MKRKAAATAIALLVGVACLVAGDTYLTRKESWRRGQPEGWTSVTANWSVAWCADSPDGGALAGQYDAQGYAVPETDAFLATTGTSRGIFTGNYRAGSTAPRAILFDFLPRDVLPSSLLFRLIGRYGGTNYVFFTSLTNQVHSAGAWEHLTVPLQYEEGNWAGGASRDFTNALGDVRQIEIRVTRRGTGAQAYAVDNCTLVRVVPPALATNDTDRDSLPNYWEQEFFGGPTNAAAGKDDDGDGLSNAEEYFGGTDPRDGSSYLRIDRIAVELDRYNLWFDSVLGRQYAAAAATGLAQPVWLPLSNQVDGAGWYMNLPVTHSGSNAFFRLRGRVP